METANENTQTDTIEQIEAALFPAKIEVNLLPETKELIRNASEMIASGATIKITSADEYAIAADQMQKVKGLAKEIEAARTIQVAPLNTLVKDVNGYYKRFAEPLASTERVIKDAMLAYSNEQERLRKLAEAKAQQDAREEAEKLAAKADKAEAKGNVEVAEAIREHAATVVAEVPVLPTAAPKVAGISKKVSYSADVKDARLLVMAAAAPMLLVKCEGSAEKLMALVRELAATNTPALAVVADTKFLNNQAKALKDNFAGMYPGCTLVKEEDISSRSQRPF
jgi:hypothetical protein